MSWQYLRASIEGGFWRDLRSLVRERVLPYQWQALNDEIPGAPKSHSMENYRIAAGLSQGEYHGMVFQDSDLAKWLEAAGHILTDPGEEKGRITAWVDEAIDVIAAAQQEDGYLDTYFTVKEPGRRWKNLREAHELYCAGHMIEAGVAAYRGTGSKKILEVVRRLADHIDSRFGPSGKIKGYPGHPEVELALVKLYRLTGEKRYLSLAKFFVDERGSSPNYFLQEAAAPDFTPIWDIRDMEYFQAHLPVREQTEATGHAVRLMYLCTAMADISLETADEELARACERLWESAAMRRMFVTGGIGTAAHHEAFTFDFDLPNDSAYAETCAAIGLFIFSNRMAVLSSDARYADVMERAIYNGALAGLALDGRAYFYVNPLEVLPEACDRNPALKHVKYRRQPWYGCACCPPNIARILASLGEYVYHADGDTLFADLYHDGSISCELEGRQVAIRQRTDYPWTGSIVLELAADRPAEFELALRIPGWCRNPSLALNGKAQDVSSAMRKGYARLRRVWRKADRLELTLPMPVERMRADPRVRADYGKVALQRGPIVYCLEETDNGPNLHMITLPPEAALSTTERPDMLGGIVAVRASGRVSSGGVPAAGLYRNGARPAATEEKQLLFIPYYSWANREPGEMTVWVQE